MSDRHPSDRELARMHEQHYDEDRHRGGEDDPPMDPFHTLVTRGWAVEIFPTSPAYTATLGEFCVKIIKYADAAQTLRSVHLYGNDHEDLMQRAADCALRIERGRALPGDTFIKGTWL